MTDEGGISMDEVRLVQRSVGAGVPGIPTMAKMVIATSIGN